MDLLISPFFKMALSRTINKAVCEHLRVCTECYNKYNMFRQTAENGKLFDELFDLLGGIPSLDEIDITLDKLEKEKVFKLSNGWEEAAKKWDLYKLLQLKCFRNLANSYQDKYTVKETDYTEFYKYLAIKWGKEIDLLERCLITECDDKELIKDEKL